MSTSSRNSTPSWSSGSSASTRTVFGLFRYCVLTQEATYLCNKLDLKIEHQPSYPMIHLAMEDVWVWDKNRPTRIIPRTDVHTTQDVTIEELKPDDRSRAAGRLQVPPAIVATDAARRRRRQHADASSASGDGEALAAHVAHRHAAALRTADDLAVQLDGLLALRDLEHAPR